MKKQSIYFISKDAAWQDYRNEILTKLGQEINIKIEILTTGKLKNFLHNNSYLTYKLFRNWIPHKWKPSFFPGALLYILLKKPKVVLCLNNTTQFTEYFAFILCKIMDIRFVWWTHAFNSTRQYKREFIRNIRQKYALPFLKKGDAIITFSEFGRSYLIKKGLNKNKIITAPNTLNTDKLLNLAQKTRKDFTRSQIAKNLTLPQDARFVLFMGRLLEEKRVDHAIKAISIVKEVIPEIHLIVIGDGKIKDELIELSNSLAPGHVSFVGGVFDDYLKAKYFSLAELFIMPGKVGLAIVFAFCYGLPIITERVDFHAPEIQYLHHGENGYFVDDGNINGIAQKSIALLCDHDKLKKFSNNAIKTVKSEANIQKMIKRMSIAIGR